MHIWYWCPFLTHIATIDAVKNSAIAIKKYSKNNDIKILNSIGEWNFFKENDKKLSVKNLHNLNFYDFLPKEGFLLSRLSFLLIFILNFFPLMRFVKREKPDFLIIHLLTILPLLLSPILSKHTKIILRISGYPEMHFLRSFFWKFFLKFVYKITTPTKLTKKLLLKKNICNKNKISLLRDPIISNTKINIKKNEKICSLPTNEKFYLSIGRLTSQKNFKFLIESFSKNINKFKVKKLMIIGYGEEYKELQNLILKNKAENNIFLLGFKKNVYKFIKKSSGFISSSNYEDPGFALIEACFLKKKIITSLVKNGPLEMFKTSDMCFFFKKNNEEDFTNKIVLSENDELSSKKILNAFKYSKEFSLFTHYKKIINLLT